MKGTGSAAPAGGGRAAEADVAVVGYNDMSFAPSSLVQLCTVAVPRGELGSTAVPVLLGRLEHPGTPPREAILPHSLAIRQTCVVAGPTASDPHRRATAPAGAPR